MVRMELTKIKIDEKKEGQVIILREKKGDRVLPIIIGVSEVYAIKRKISGIDTPRPMTHDLLADTIAKLGAKLEKVTIEKLELNTFFATLTLLTKDNETLEIDSRPSDAIALAVRTNSPIFAQEKILEQIAGLEGDSII